MEPKTNPELQAAPAPSGEGLASPVEVWDPPFERWIRLADTLLGTVEPPFAKAGPPLKAPLLKH